MSEDAAFAEAPSAIVSEQPTIPQPLGSQTPVREGKPTSEAPNSVKARQSLDKADATLKAGRAAEQAKANVDELARLEKLEGKRDKLSPAEDRARALKTASARLKVDAEAKEAAGREFAEPPARFSPDAKAAWQTAPEPVKAEVHRAVRELEGGIERYRASHQAWDQVRKYDDIARQNGGSLPQSLAKVVEIEQAFGRSPVEGLHAVCSHFGFDLHQVASHIAGMRPEQFQQMHSQSQVAAMQQQMQQMQHQHQQVLMASRQMQTSMTVQSFAASHPRFDELHSEIVAELWAGYSLEDAYERAVKLAGPSKSRGNNPAGTKSISGAPSSGASPASEGKPSSSNREALQRAMARVGRI